MKKSTYLLVMSLLTTAILSSVGCDWHKEHSGRAKPSSVFIEIDGGASTTGDTLIEIAVRGYFIDFMELSLDSLFRGSEWEPYDSIFGFSIPRREGMLKVFARFYTDGGDTSGIYYKSIRVDLSANITRFDISAPNDTLRPGDILTFAMETGEEGLATVQIGELASHFKLFATGNGVYSRNYTIPDGFNGIAVRPIGEFEDQVGNIAALNESVVTYLVTGENLAPRLVSSVAIQDFSSSEVCLKDGYLFASAAEFKLHLIDVSPPENPNWVTAFDLAGAGAGISGNDQILAVADGESVSIFAINPPQGANQIGRVLLPGKPRDVLVYGNYAFVACVFKGLYVIDLRELRSPRVLGHVEMDGYGESLTQNHDTVFVGGISGIAAVDVHDVQNPQLISELPIDGLPIEEVYWEGRLYVATSRSGVVVVNVEDAEHMEIEYIHRELTSCNSLVLQAPYLFIGGYNNVRIVNAAIPEILPIVGEVTGLWQTRGMVINHHLVYIAALNGLHIIEYFE